MDKSELRRVHTELINSTPADVRAAADEKICRGVLSLAEYQNAESVFIYVSVGCEVSTSAIISDALACGKRVYVPRCEKGGVMHAARLESLADLCGGMFGIPTAPVDAQVAEPNELDLIIVPGVCFDRAGSRLGRGGGYYDRYLARPLRAAIVGVCRAAQLVGHVAVAPHDRAMDAVVCDIGVFSAK